MDCTFRVFHKTLGVDWAHINARICGRLSGCPVFLAIYTNASMETDMRFNQVFFNLLSNAVKYTPENGTITCVLKSKRDSGGRFLLDSTVSDTGIGMILNGFSRGCFNVTYPKYGKLN